MRLVKWEFRGMVMPMIEADDGVLYCTSVTLQRALNICNSSIRKIWSRHGDELEARTGLSLTDCQTKEFVAQHKEEFGIRRLREDIHFWCEDDMLMLAILSKADASKAFRKELIRFIKEQARKEYVLRSIYDETSARLTAIEEILRSAGFALKENASTAGKLLNQQKDTKHLRLLTGGTV